MGLLSSRLSLGPPRLTPSLEVLNATLGGRVHFVVPYAHPCFSLGSRTGADSLYNNHTCAHVVEQYTNRDSVVDAFSAYLNSGGTICLASGEQCLLDAYAPNNSKAFLPPRKCQQGNLPSLYVDVRGAADVSAAFGFVRRTKMPVSIKNTGHDYLSRSAGARSLSLWMHNLRDLSFDAAFIPSGCDQPGLPAITFGTGVLTGTLNAFAHAHNVTMPGGADSSVALGGGYLLVILRSLSAFSNAFGLAVDRVLQFQVVTPDGVHRTVNACSHPDLFFALRGGGSGFCAVLNVTMKALPKLDSFPVVVTAFKEKPNAATQTKYIDFLIDNALTLASKGGLLRWGGYIEPSLGLTFVNPFVSMEEAEGTMTDLKQLVETELNSTFILQRETSYLSFYDHFVEPTTLPNHAPSALASRLIPASLFNDDATTATRSALRDAIVAAAQRHDITFLFAVAPHFFGKGDGQTSITPAWRDALWHVFYIDYWTFDTTPAQRARIYQRLEEDAQVLRRIAPDSGVYWNEASVFEPDHARAFWGSNYERLLAIKQKYDPDHLLDCWKCVGWRGASDPRFKCQQPPRVDESKAGSDPGYFDLNMMIMQATLGAGAQATSGETCQPWERE
ncbi:FAD-binding domain-containing protein [Trametes gibbosa]|nr:FAD-binding domain-containing protein [Trametes gibbosa]